MQDRNSDSFIDGRRRFIRTGLGVAGGLALPDGLRIKSPGRRPAADRHLAGGRVRQFGVHRHQRAAHRHLRGAGRGRAQGLPAGRRAHQCRPSADQADLAQDHQGGARQGAEVRRRRLGRQAERRGAGAAALHHREQGNHDHRRHVQRGGRGAEQAGASARRCCSCAASPARTTPPARTACATGCGRTSTARRRPTRSARRCSRPTARTRRRRS